MRTHCEIATLASTCVTSWRSSTSAYEKSGDFRARRAVHGGGRPCNPDWTGSHQFGSRRGHT
eukprot:4810031-Prymnesium_polylepis.1